MKQVAGFWLPDSEKHLIPMLEIAPKFFKKPTYQVDKFLGCLQYIQGFGHAVDIGAHCGLWSNVLVHVFAKLSAFEPLPRHIGCWRKNIPDANATLHEYALGEVATTLSMIEEQDSTGDSRVDPKGSRSVVLNRLDSVGLPPIDFMKLDCEGYEKFALKGGEQTIRRDRPCIIVEQKPRKAKQYGLGDTEAVELLKSWGAKLRFTLSGDYCLSWDR